MASPTEPSAGTERLPAIGFERAEQLPAVSLERKEQLPAAAGARAPREMGGRGLISVIEGRVPGAEVELFRARFADEPPPGA